ncbi:MAG: DUF4349 domain-containing protein [Candidatus Nanohaloarchaea archaeon]
MMDYTQLSDSIERKHVVALALVMLTGGIGAIHTVFQGTNTGGAQSVRYAGAGGAADLGVSASHRTAEASRESPSSERKRIRTVDIRFEVTDPSSAAELTEKRAREFGGYVTDTSFSRDDGVQTGVTARIPSGNLSDFTSDLESEGWRLERKDVNIRDVTERYTELELELKNKRSEMARLEELQRSANSTESLIKIQERMSELRSRIQYLENELENIDRRVEYVEVRIDFTEPRPITAEFKAMDSLRDSYMAVFTSLRWMVVGTGYILPFGLVYGLYRLLKRLRERRD